jgi:hypothetical protein
MPRGGALWPVVSIVLLFASLFFFAFVGEAKTAAELRFVREAPHASLGAPRSGPALYAGTISGPDARVDFHGEHAAATWWWVTERVSKNHYKTACFEHRIDGLRFHDDAGGSAPLAMFEGKATLSLFGRDRSDTWTEPLQIDLAELSPLRPKPWPAEAERCQGQNRSFVTRTLPRGARVEVLACFEPGKDGGEGRLLACPTLPAAVVSVDGMSHYLERRALSAASPFLTLALMAAVVLSALTFVAFRFRARAIKPVVPR